jgi:hypothetical protein
MYLVSVESRNAMVATGDDHPRHGMLYIVGLVEAGLHTRPHLVEAIGVIGRDGLHAPGPA